MTSSISGKEKGAELQKVFAEVKDIFILGKHQQQTANGRKSWQLRESLPSPLWPRTLFWEVAAEGTAAATGLRDFLPLSVPLSMVLHNCTPHYWCTGQMEEAAETPWKGHDPWSTNKGKSLGPKIHTQIVKLMTDFFTECEAPRSSHWAEHCLCKHFQSAFIPIWERKCSGKLVRMDSHEVSNNTHVLLKSEIPQVKLWACSFLILSQTRQHQGMWTHWRENLTKLSPSFYVCQKIHPSSRKVSSL